MPALFGHAAAGAAQPRACLTWAVRPHRALLHSWPRRAAMSRRRPNKETAAAPAPARRGPGPDGSYKAAALGRDDTQPPLSSPPAAPVSSAEGRGGSLTAPFLPSPAPGSARRPTGRDAPVEVRAPGRCPVLAA